MRNKTTWLFCCAAALLLSLAGCAGAPKGDRAEDYLPLKEPWTGIFTKTGGKEPQKLVVKHAAPKGRVWVIDVAGFFGGGQFGLLVTSEERGILLHAILTGQIHKMEPPQVLMPRTLSEGSGWSSSASDVRITGGADLAEITVGARQLRARLLQVQFKLQGKETTLAFWLSPGAGIVRFQGGLNDLQGDWDFAEVAEEKK